MSEKKKDPRREIQKYKRDLMRNAMGVGEESSTNQRIYGEATKTRRAVKTELFGNKSKMVDTTIEVWVEDFLKEKQIKFVKQKAIRYLNYDFFLKDYNIIIECQGCYWHCCPICYPAGPKNNIQKINLTKNDAKRKVAAEAKKVLIEIWSHEIEKTPDVVKQRIESVLSYDPA